MKKIIINNTKFISVNKYNNLHWTKRKEYKDYLRLKLDKQINFKSINSGYDLHFLFQYTKRAYDTINYTAMIKIIEDRLFLQDKDNGKICIEKEKSTDKQNHIIITLKKIKKKF